MSLVTHPNHIIIEEEDTLDDDSEITYDIEEQRFLQALRGFSDDTDYEIRRNGRNTVSIDRRKIRENNEKQKENERKLQEQIKKKNQKRFDPQYIDRLTISTAASRARSQRKYVDQILEKRQQKQKELKEVFTVSRSISPIATKAGVRLYAAAVGQKRRLDSLRAEQEEHRKEKEEKLTFQPKITNLAKDLGNNGYKPPHERYNHTKEKLAKNFLLRERERMDRVMKDCTFHPTVTATSAKIAQMKRKNEPFEDVGERLFFEGGHRLIRQQLRKRIMEQTEENKVIGAFQISHEAAEELASRLLKWQKVCEKNREATREEYVRSATQPLPLKSHSTWLSQREKNQNHSSSNSNSNKKKNNQNNKHNDIQLKHLEDQKQQGEKEEEEEEEEEEKEEKKKKIYDENFIGRPSKDELRRIRCQALFAKYTSSEKSKFISLQDVKRQVRELFPEDSSVVAALAADFNDTEAISRDSFVESLLKFEQQNGPQPWGNPTCDHVFSAFGNFSNRSNDIDIEGKTELATSKEKLTLQKPLRRSNSTIALTRKQKKEMVSPHPSTYPSLSSTMAPPSVSVSVSPSASASTKANVKKNPTSNYRRALSASSSTMNRPLIKNNSTSLKSGKNYNQEKGKSKNVKNQLIRQCSNEINAIQKEKQFLDQQEAELRRKQQELLYMQKNSLRMTKKQVIRKSKERSISPGSVELSSFTEDCGSTPNSRRPEDIVAELEALVSTPVERSSTASPKQFYKKHSNDMKLVNFPLKSSSTSVPTPLRRPLKVPPVPSKIKVYEYMNGSNNDNATQDQIVKEVEKLLNTETKR